MTKLQLTNHQKTLIGLILLALILGFCWLVFEPQYLERRNSSSNLVLVKTETETIPKHAPTAAQLATDSLKWALERLPNPKDTLERWRLIKFWIAQHPEEETRNSIYHLLEGYLGWKKVYEETEVPVDLRLRSLNIFLKKGVVEGRFKDSRKLLAFRDKHFSEQNCATCDSLAAYFLKIDSLEKTSPSTDTLDFFKARWLEKIWNTEWFCSGNCAGCEVFLEKDALIAFLKKHPKSAFIDRAEWRSMELDLVFCVGSCVHSIKDLNSLKRRFPESELIPEWDLAILANEYEIFEQTPNPNPKPMSKKINGFLAKYPDHREKNTLRHWLRSIFYFDSLRTAK